MATRSPLFCDTALARRIERAETRLIADAGRAAQARTGTDGFVIPIAGGMASFAEPDSPFNKVVGLGFDGVPSAAELDAIEKAFAAHGAPTQVELAHLAESGDRRAPDRPRLPPRVLRERPRPRPRQRPGAGHPARHRGAPQHRRRARRLDRGRRRRQHATPTPRGCPGTTSSPRSHRERRTRLRRRGRHPLRRLPRRRPRGRRRLPHHRRHRPARGRRHRTGASPPRRADRAGRRPARRCQGRGMRCRRHRHPAGLQVTAERAAPRASTCSTPARRW